MKKGSVKWYILALLAFEGALNGYKIENKGYFDKYKGETVTRNLRKLAELKLIKRFLVGDRNDFYSITKKGKQALKGIKCLK